MSKFLCYAMAVFTGGILMSMLGCSSSSPAPISVSLSPSSSQAIDESQTVVITASLTNDVSSKGVVWSLIGPGSLSSTTGLSVTYTSPTNLTSAQTATVMATSAADQTKSASLAISVNLYPQILFQSLPSGSVGQTYSQAIALSGGSSPFQWSIYNGPIPTGWKVGGSLPNGLTLNAGTGTISGTPTVGGTWYFEAVVTDATGVTVDNGFLSIQINQSASSGNPVPFLNQPVVPTAVPPGSGDFVLNLSGAGFVSAAKIYFNGTALATTFIDGEHLSGVVPAADVASAGNAAITVVNPGPGGGTSNTAYFQIGATEASVNFVSAANSPLQVPEVWQLAVADFNEDGKTDLAATGGIKLYTMLGKGDGTFTAASGSPIPVPSPPYDDLPSPYTWALAPGDFNRSGHAGLAISLASNLSAVILFGNGDGTFSYSSSLANTGAMHSGALTTADFNGDGNLDLFALGTLNGPSPTVLLGYGAGAFNSVPQNALLQEISPLGGLWGVTAAVGDFDENGTLDVAVAAGLPTSTSGIAPLMGNGDGTFSVTSGSQMSLGPGLSAMVAADFNGDGKLDLAAVDVGTNAAYVLLGNGDGTFQSPMTIPVGNNPAAIAVGDFTNNGKLDLAIANATDNTVTLLMGNGDGTFTEESGSPFAVGKQPESIVAADFNGDGKLDLAVANWADYSVSILLQQ